MLGLGHVDGLDDDGELVVERGGLLQHVGITSVVQERNHLLAQGVVDGDTDIVDGGLRIPVELLVEADGIRKLDRR